MQTWTVFQSKSFDAEKKAWKTQCYFMMGDAKNFDKIDFKTDWRFKEVEGKRKQAILIGDVDLEHDAFPIHFPLQLKNGRVVINSEGRFD